MNMMLLFPHNNRESFSVPYILCFAGGFLDVYSYLFRGHVFANAITGNIVLLGVNIALGEWNHCAKYLLSILTYGFGIFTANSVHHLITSKHSISWQKSVLIMEIILISLVAFIPPGTCDYYVNAMISFVCAMQVQTFRTAHSLPFASTMCTGNLRSGTDALFQGTIHKNMNELTKAARYYGMIAAFLSGSIAGTILLRQFSDFFLLLVPVILLTAILRLSPTNKKRLRISIRKKSASHCI